MAAPSPVHLSYHILAGTFCSRSLSMRLSPCLLTHSLTKHLLTPAVWQVLCWGLRMWCSGCSRGSSLAESSQDGSERKPREEGTSLERAPMGVAASAVCAGFLEEMASELKEGSLEGGTRGSSMCTCGAPETPWSSVIAGGVLCGGPWARS